MTKDLALTTILQMLPTFIMLAEMLFGGKTGPAKKDWVINQITAIINQLVTDAVQKNEVWAAVWAVLNSEYPEFPEEEEPETPQKQTFLGKLIDWFAGLFA